jgi:hypothetical protein
MPPWPCSSGAVAAYSALVAPCGGEGWKQRGSARHGEQAQGVQRSRRAHGPPPPSASGGARLGPPACLTCLQRALAGREHEGVGVEAHGVAGVHLGAGRRGKGGRGGVGRGRVGRGVRARWRARRRGVEWGGGACPRSRRVAGRRTLLVSPVATMPAGVVVPPRGRAGRQTYCSAGSSAPKARARRPGTAALPCPALPRTRVHREAVDVLARQPQAALQLVAEHDLHGLGWG